MVSFSLFFGLLPRLGAVKVLFVCPFFRVFFFRAKYIWLFAQFVSPAAGGAGEDDG